MAEAEEKAKTKQSKKSARQRVINKYLVPAEKQKGAFADPAKFMS